MNSLRLLGNKEVLSGRIADTRSRSPISSALLREARSVQGFTQMHSRVLRLIDGALGSQSISILGQDLTQVLHSAIEHEVRRSRYMRRNKDTWLCQQRISFTHGLIFHHIQPRPIEVAALYRRQQSRFNRPGSPDLH